jgi:hypothetical protein
LLVTPLRQARAAPIRSQLLVSDAILQAAGDALGVDEQVGPLVVGGYLKSVSVWRLA